MVDEQGRPVGVAAGWARASTDLTRSRAPADTTAAPGAGSPTGAPTDLCLVAPGRGVHAGTNDRSPEHHRNLSPGVRQTAAESSRERSRTILAISAPRWNDDEL